MEHLGITESKRLALKAKILEMSKEGKSWRQIMRMALHKFNVKIPKPKL